MKKHTEEEKAEIRGKAEGVCCRAGALVCTAALITGLAVLFFYKDALADGLSDKADSLETRLEGAEMPGIPTDDAGIFSRAEDEYWVWFYMPRCPYCSKAADGGLEDWWEEGGHPLYKVDWTQSEVGTPCDADGNPVDGFADRRAYTEAIVKAGASSAEELKIPGTPSLFRITDGGTTACALGSGAIISFCAA